MSKKEKLIKRLKSNPMDFTFDEALTLLSLHGYSMSASGKTSGSRVRFAKGERIFHLHKPHPRKELLRYQINAVLKELEEGSLL
ncbi:MAG: type II toxin-antitoxin system HicA family toxin [Oscillospiraceae bacterium]|nr:type II toxin-antitoxin system HicA family toxin [Oscillospiraceae bacterium]